MSQGQPGSLRGTDGTADLLAAWPPWTRRHSWVSRVLRHMLETGMVLICALVGSTAEHQHRIHKAFDVAEGGKLVLRADRGDVEVTRTPGTNVLVEVLRSSSGARALSADRIAEEHRVQLVQENGTITVKAGPASGGWARVNTLRVRYRFEVPGRFDLDLRTASGRVRVDGGTGSVDAATSSGEIHVTGLNGRVGAKSAGGLIRVERLEGDVEANTTGADVRLSAISGRVHAAAAGGNVQVEGASGAADLRTTGGGIVANGLRGGLIANATGGSLKAGFLQGLNHDSRLSATGGDVELWLPDDFAAEVEAMAFGGDVTSEVPVTQTGKPKESALKGSMRTGGARLMVRATGGAIRFRKNGISPAVGKP